MQSNKWKIVLVLAVSTSLTTVLAKADDGNSTWIDSLKEFGKVYSGEDDSVIQEVKLFGRAHYQWNYSDGSSAGDSFSGNGDELRRLRAGASVEFLNGISALGRLNLEKGGFRNTTLGYSSFDELFIDYSFSNSLGFDSASIGYGRYKVALGGEEHESSKRIKTIERSNINNRFGSIRPTGVFLNGEKDGTSYSVGVFSTERDRETWAGWDGGIAFYGSAEFEAGDGTVILDFIHADDSDNDQSIFDYNWVTSASYTRSYEKIDFFASASYSDTDSGSIFGFVLMPSSFIIDDKLELVGRYQYGQSSEDTSVPKSSSSRGLRRVARNEGVGTGSGDENHTFYLGLNYFLQGHNSKIMTGVEYEDISGSVGRDLSGYTFWTAYRFYF